MKVYPERLHERDQICECGHIAYEHSTQLLRNLFNDKLFTGKCDSCMCNKFKKVPDNTSSKGESRT